MKEKKSKIRKAISVDEQVFEKLKTELLSLINNGGDVVSTSFNDVIKKLLAESEEFRKQQK